MWNHPAASQIRASKSEMHLKINIVLISWSACLKAKQANPLICYLQEAPQQIHMFLNHRFETLDAVLNNPYVYLAEGALAQEGRWRSAP